MRKQNQDIRNISQILFSHLHNILDTALLTDVSFKFN